jgi:hypothetical protein
MLRSTLDGAPLPSIAEPMAHEPRHKQFGHTIEEWIALVPGELPIAEISLWHVVVAGREGFGLSGEALTDYMRRNIFALLDAGAKPVTHVANAIHGRGWLPVDYGSTPDQIADTIIAEWLAEGAEPNFRVWFTLPHNCLKP